MVGQSCRVCQGEASKRCGGCHQVYYCSKDHQKLDWLGHKNTCKPFKVCEDEVVGRHLVTTRDLRAGEVVLREGPLLQGPSQITGPVCLGCLQAVSRHNSEPCEKCGWPLCRKPACRQAPQHLPECQWTVDKRKSPVKISQFISPHPSYECIVALRLCYYRQHNPGLWARLAALQTHTEQRRHTPKYQQDTKSIAQFLRTFYKLEDEFSDEQIMDIWGIIQVNGHEVPITQPCHVAVYDLSSMLEHSCRPNCAKSFTDSGALVIRVMAALPSGTPLTICYTDSLWGTSNRQYHLQDTKFFSCSCDRCLDPTELGTFFSALLCQQGECSGRMLPASLRSVTADTPWTCDRCGHSLPDHQVEGTIHEAGQELTTLATQDISASLRFLEKWGARFHPNHYYLTEVRLAVTQRLGQDSAQGVQGLSDQQLQLKIDLCRQLLQLLSIVAPAECRVRGTLYFEIHSSLAERARRDHLLGQGDLLLTFQESRRCLEQTIYLLEQEPEVLPEGQLLRQAKLNKCELDKTLQSVHAMVGGIPAM